MSQTTLPRGLPQGITIVNLGAPSQGQTTHNPEQFDKLLKQLAEMLTRLMPQLRGMASGQTGQIQGQQEHASNGHRRGNTVQPQIGPQMLLILAPGLPSEAVPASNTSANPATTNDAPPAVAAADQADARPVPVPPAPVVRPIGSPDAPIVKGEARASSETRTRNATIAPQVTEAEQDSAVARNSADPLAAVVVLGDQ